MQIIISISLDIIDETEGEMTDAEIITIVTITTYALLGFLLMVILWHKIQRWFG